MGHRVGAALAQEMVDPLSVQKDLAPHSEQYNKDTQFSIKIKDKNDM